MQKSNGRAKAAPAPKKAVTPKPKASAAKTKGPALKKKTASSNRSKTKVPPKFDLSFTDVKNHKLNLELGISDERKDILYSKVIDRLAVGGCKGKDLKALAAFCVSIEELVFISYLYGAAIQRQISLNPLAAIFGAMAN